MFKPSVILLEYTDQLREIDHGGATRRSPRIPQLRQWFTINRLSVDYGNNYGLRFGGSTSNNSVMRAQLTSDIALLTSKIGYLTREKWVLNISSDILAL